MSAIVFMDTETTGLTLDDDIWEFAAIRRDPGEPDWECHLFIEHDPAKCNQLPEPFLSDHRRRWPTSPADVVPREFAAKYISDLTKDRPHIVGAVPNFDTERLSLLLNRHGYRWGGHYHLIDVENLAVGYLGRQGAATSEHLAILREVGDEERAVASAEKELARLRGLITPPWDSDELSRAIGVEPPGDGVRHTAMGDARHAMAIYDRIIGKD